jgi:chalcone isomerase-like protein/GTP cyclohydrolase I-like protein
MSTVALLRKTDECESSAELRGNVLFDLPRIERAVREILFAVGEDPDRDGLVETPRRVARAYAELLAGLREDPAQARPRSGVQLSQTANTGVPCMKHQGAALLRLVRVIVGGLFIVAWTVQPSAATELEGVHFADQYRSGNVTMRLSCVGLLRYKLFIKAYVAALYLGEGAANRDVFADVPKRLELSYFWSIRSADFGKAGDAILAQNVDAQTFAALRPRLDRINALYRDVKPGDRYSLTYVPGVGTELALNGRPLGVIDGADFGAAYFRIWLGDHSIDARLRDQLLPCARRDVEDVHASLPMEHGVP